MSITRDGGICLLHAGDGGICLLQETAVYACYRIGGICLLQEMVVYAYYRRWWYMPITCRRWRYMPITGDGGICLLHAGDGDICLLQEMAIYAYYRRWRYIPITGDGGICLLQEMVVYAYMPDSGGEVGGGDYRLKGPGAAWGRGGGGGVRVIDP